MKVQKLYKQTKIQNLHVRYEIAFSLIFAAFLAIQPKKLLKDQNSIIWRNKNCSTKFKDSTNISQTLADRLTK